MEENPELRGDEFDFMSVFTILDHIKVIDGYQLAYVYQYDGMGGYPTVYAYPEGTQPYVSFDEYIADKPECFDSTVYVSGCDILTYLETDGSPLGFLQLVLFDTKKGRFNLYWHSAYCDRHFIATPSGLDAIILNISDPLLPLSGSQKRAAQRIDPTPEVLIGDEMVDIRVTWFTKWGGFNETHYALSREYPHLILSTESQNLVEYDCGIMF